MKWICLLAIFCASCGSDPVARPFAAQPVTKKKALSGKVTFTGLTSSQLFDFRLIPETGNELIIPIKATHDQVDGLWWRKSEPGMWLKIPDSSEVWIGQAPEEYEGVIQHGGLPIYYRSSALLRAVGLMKKSIRRPAWVKDEGATASPVPSPWNLD